MISYGECEPGVAIPPAAGTLRGARQGTDWCVERRNALEHDEKTKQSAHEQGEHREKCDSRPALAHAGIPRLGDSGLGIGQERVLTLPPEPEGKDGGGQGRTGAHQCQDAENRLGTGPAAAAPERNDQVSGKQMHHPRERTSQQSQQQPAAVGYCRGVR
jgi:hypothetical protein